MGLKKENPNSGKIKEANKILEVFRNEKDAS